MLNSHQHKRFKEAQKLYKQGKFDDALKIYNVLLLKVPQYAWTHYEVGRCYLQKGQFNLAMAGFNEAAGYLKSSKFKSARIAFARELSEKKRYKEAAVVFQPIAENTTNKKEVIKGIIYRLKVEDVDTCERLLVKYIVQFPEILADVLSLSNIDEYIIKRLKNRTESIIDALKANTDDVVEAAKTALTYLKEVGEDGLYQELFDDWDKALERFDFAEKVPQILEAQSAMQKIGGRIEEEREALEKSIERRAIEKEHLLHQKEFSELNTISLELYALLKQLPPVAVVTPAAYLKAVEEFKKRTQQEDLIRVKRAYSNLRGVITRGKFNVKEAQKALERLNEAKMKQVRLQAEEQKQRTEAKKLQLEEEKKQLALEKKRKSYTRRRDRLKADQPALKKKLRTKGASKTPNKPIKSTVDNSSKSPKRGRILVQGLGISLLLIGVVAFFVRDSFNLHSLEKVSSYQTLLTDVTMRTTPAEEKEGNSVGTYQEGELLEVLEQNGKWQKVRASDGNVGYMASKYLVTPPEYDLIQGISGNAVTADLLKGYAARHKKALLEYYKHNNWTSNVPDTVEQQVYGSISGREVYQLFAKERDNRYDRVKQGDFMNSGRDDDFAFVVSSDANSYLAVYAYDADDTPILVHSEELSSSEYDFRIVNATSDNRRWRLPNEQGDLDWMQLQQNVLLLRTAYNCRYIYRHEYGELVKYSQSRICDIGL